MAFDFPSGPTELQLYAPTGGPTYKYVAPGWRVVDSGTAFDPDSRTIFNAFTTPPTQSRKELIDKCVKALKAGGVWDKLDVLYAFAAADAQAAKINWKNPGTFNCTEVNAPNFAADSGFKASASQYISTSFNPTTAPSPKFVRDSASAFIWSDITGNINAYAWGAAPGAGHSWLVPRHWDGHLRGTLNADTSYQQSTALITATGDHLAAVSRSNASTVSGYFDGVANGTNASLASQAPFNAVFQFFGAQAGYWWTDRARAGGFGSQLSDADNIALYNALNAYMASVAIDRIFAAFTTPPTEARKTLIRNCVTALQSAGVWDKLDALYAFAAADAQAAKINWKNPGTFNVTLVNAPVFTADQGFAGNGTSNYLDSSFNPTTAPSPKFTQNSASIFGWSNTNVTFNSPMLGSTGAASSNTVIYPRYGTGNFYARVNTLANMTAASADSLGFWNVVRSGASAGQLYKNTTTLVPSDTGASAAMHNAPMLFLASPPEFWLGQIAAGGFGSTLTAADNAALYNALNAYMTGLFEYQAETNAIAAAFTTSPTTARKDRIDAAVVALKNAGVWAKLDTLYLFAAADVQAAKINWVAPGTYDCVEVNAPTFTADRGFTGASTKYLDTNFDISTSVKWVRDSACVFAWSLTDANLNNSMVGNTATSVIVNPRFTDGIQYGRVNATATNIIGGTPSTGFGFLSATRSGASANELFKNGVSVGTATTASLAPTSVTMNIFRSSTSYWAGEAACAGFGSHLNSTEQLALYNALVVYMAGLATDRIVAAFTTPPSAARKTLIQTCVTSLITAGVWDKLDALYAFAAADSQAGLINWKQPGTYNGTLVNSPAFVVDQGFTGAATKYIETSFNPSTAPTPKLTQNDGSIFAWGLNTGAATEVTFGSGASTQDSFIYPRYSGDVTHYGVNQSSNSTVASTNGSGLFLASRTGASAIQAYRNGVAHGALQSTASATVGNTTFRMMSRNGTNNYTGTITCAGFGSQVDSTQQLALYNALRAYLTGVGVP